MMIEKATFQQCKYYARGGLIMAVWPDGTRDIISDGADVSLQLQQTLGHNFNLDCSVM